MADAVSTEVPARGRLLAWYDQHARDLPWRRTRDPYAIWVSEIMLQQTRVDTVIPYYGRFLSRFPTVHSLAEASEDDVLAHWSGLGYYRRARFLHQGAKTVASKHDGKVPRDPEARRAIPGVGRYTAGAIGSIAFDLPEPIVDGNVARVLSRQLGIDAPLGERKTEQELWSHAEAWAKGERPGHLNQALMELGATVCTPQNPRCDACPIKKTCVALKTERVELLPIMPKKKAPKAVSLVSLLSTDAAGSLWLLRGEGSLFGGLWGFPSAEGKGRASAEALAEASGLEGKLSPKPLGHVQHVLTHRSLDIEVFAFEVAGGRSSAQKRKVSLSELESLGVSSLTRKILSFQVSAGQTRATSSRKKARGA